MLPMRDGVKLHTRIVMPREDKGGKFTTIIDRSPYGYSDLEWIPGVLCNQEHIIYSKIMN